MTATIIYIISFRSRPPTDPTTVVIFTVGSSREKTFLCQIRQ